MSPETESALVRALEVQASNVIASAYLFGSVAAGREHRESDVDIAVLFRRDALPTARERFEQRLLLSSSLAAVAGRPVNLVALNDVPPHFARRIVLDGNRILRLDADADHAFVRDVQLRAADLEPFLRRTRQIKLDRLRES